MGVATDELAHGAMVKRLMISKLMEETTGITRCACSNTATTFAHLVPETLSGPYKQLQVRLRSLYIVIIVYKIVHNISLGVATQLAKDGVEAMSRASLVLDND